MKIFGSTVSPYVRKLAAYAKEKGLEAELVFAGAGVAPPEFKACSPFGKIPAFMDDDGFGISDSTAIIAYLEAKHPTPALIPEAPQARARAIWFEEFADTLLMAAANKIFFNLFICPKLLKRPGDEAAAQAVISDELPRLLDYLETQIPASGFLVGDSVSLADIAVASPFVNYAHVGVEIDRSRWPKTVAYVDAILQRPSFAPMIAAERGFIASKG